MRNHESLLRTAGELTKQREITRKVDDTRMCSILSLDCRQISSVEKHLLSVFVACYEYKLYTFNILF